MEEVNHYGHGHGHGAGYGYGDSYGYGYSYGDGYGDGYGYGDGNGYGYGSNYGYSDGYGYGYGYGDGDGHGCGTGSIELVRAFLRQCAAAGTLEARWVLGLPNAEQRRAGIECLGAQRFFTELQGKVVHADVDGVGYPRRLVRIPMEEARVGYLQAVHVVCPTTLREYWLGVPPTVKTCQEAVASTFGIQPDEYRPVRES